MRTIALILLSLPTCVAVSQFSWEQRADLPLSGLWGPATFVIGDKGYVVSGRSNGVDITNVWMYDPDLDTWTPRAPIPVARRFAAGFAINGKGYVACGLNSVSNQLADVWEYDPVADVWTSKANFPGDARYGTCHFAVGGYGYLGTGNLGSSSGPYATNMYAYDPVSNSWSTRASIPGMARYGTSTITAGGKAYVIGGRVADLTYTDDIYEYDASSNSWLLRTPFPGSRRTYAMAFSYNTDGVIVAGHDGTVNLYDAHRFLPSMNLWSTVPTYPGEAGWVGANMAISGRSFGGLGYRLSSGLDHDDWWELVKEGTMPGMMEIASCEMGSLSIHPDPVEVGQLLRFDWSDLGQAGMHYRMEIFNIGGGLAWSDRMGFGQTLVCPELGQGLYTVRLQRDDNLMWRARFVVM